MLSTDMSTVYPLIPNSYHVKLYLFFYLLYNKQNYNKILRRYLINSRLRSLCLSECNNILFRE